MHAAHRETRRGHKVRGCVWARGCVDGRGGRRASTCAKVGGGQGRARGSRRWRCESSLLGLLRLAQGRDEPSGTRCGHHPPPLRRRAYWARHFGTSANWRVGSAGGAFPSALSTGVARTKVDLRRSVVSKRGFGHGLRHTSSARVKSAVSALTLRPRRFVHQISPRQCGDGIAWR